jgi:hypothetical protein
MLHTLTPMQSAKLEHCEANHPATSFTITTWIGAAVVIDYADMESEGSFAITPSGRTFTMNYEATTDSYVLPLVIAA